MVPQHKLEVPHIEEGNRTPDIITDKYSLRIKSESPRLRYSIGEYVDGELELYDIETNRMVSKSSYMLPISTGEINGNSVDWSLYRILINLTGYYTMYRARWVNTHNADIVFRRATVGLTPFIDKNAEDYKGRIKQFKQQISELFYNNCCQLRYTNPKFSSSMLISQASKITAENIDVQCFQVTIGISSNDFTKLFEEAKRLAINKYNNTNF